MSDSKRTNDLGEALEGIGWLIIYLVGGAFLGCHDKTVYADEISWVPCEEKDLTPVECFYIYLYRPKLNGGIKE
jgi:hypothetical protein